jgi:hypothetical protein
MDTQTAETWQQGLELLAQSVESFLELKSPEGVAIAFMVKAAVSYAQAIYNKKHPITGTGQ